MINNIDSNYSNDKTNAEVAMEQVAEAKRIVNELYEMQQKQHDETLDSLDSVMQIATEARDSLKSDVDEKQLL